MLFTLTTQINGDFTTVTAERSGRAIAVQTPRGVSPVRNINQATKIAADLLGPLLEPAGRMGAEWGLYVAVEGGAAALFGRFPPELASPELTGPPAKPADPVAQIFRHWERRDGTPLGALEAALKIIEIYTSRGRVRAAA